MLSRVANSLYWMSRYLERAENVARILDVNLQLLLDFPNMDQAKLTKYWQPVVSSSGDEELFFNFYDEANGRTVPDFLVFRPDNPNSIASSVGSARENARMVRDQIPFELWEEINRLHLYVQSAAARSVWARNPSEFFYAIKHYSHGLQGLTDATIPHTEGWNFMQVGKFLERADKTTRILDVRHGSVPEAAGPAVISHIDALEWAAVLRSCSAWDAYRRIHSVDVDPRRAVAFLVLSDDFPRSVSFCLSACDSALRRISGVPECRFLNEAEKLSGRLVSEIRFSSADDIFAAGLHDYLDRLQRDFNAIGTALFATYIFQPFQAESGQFRPQQQQQQQQQCIHGELGHVQPDERLALRSR